MKRYWRIYKDSYYLLKNYPTSDGGNLSKVEYFYKWKGFFICESDDDYYGWMPFYHGSGSKYSDEPCDGYYNSLEYFRRENYTYCGVLGRKSKLERLKKISDENR